MRNQFWVKDDKVQEFVNTQEAQVRLIDVLYTYRPYNMCLECQFDLIPKKETSSVFKFIWSSTSAVNDTPDLKRFGPNDNQFSFQRIH